jgi:outer membrane protein
VDVRAREKQIEAAGEQVAVAQSGYWPSLDFSASFGADYNSLDRDSFRGQFFDDNVGGALGLTLAVPIFDRQQTRNQVALARIRQQDARWSLLQQQLQAEAEIGQALQDFRTAQKLIGVTDRRLTAARQALAAVEERYRVGAATLVELTQARAQFVEAGYERVRARYGLITQGVAVAYYQGDWEQMRSLLTMWESSQ